LQAFRIQGDIKRRNGRMDVLRPRSTEMGAVIPGRDRATKSREHDPSLPRCLRWAEPDGIGVVCRIAQQGVDQAALRRRTAHGRHM